MSSPAGSGSSHAPVPERPPRGPIAAGAPAPGIHASLQELVALRARSRELQAPRKRSSDRSSGPTVSAFRGRGMEYAESRPYAPGDDVRHIDWRVTARTGRAHSKVFQAERDRVTMLLVDRAEAMYFGTRTRLKSAQAARLAATLAWAAFAEGDRICAGAGAELVPPARGRRGVLHALGALSRWSEAPEHATEAGLAMGLAAASRVLHPGSHLLLLADARSITPQVEQPLRQLAAHGDVVVGLVCDALELEPPPPGRYVAFHGGHRMALALEGRADRARWSAHFQALREDAASRLRRAGVRVAVVAAHEDCVGALRTLLRRRIGAGRSA